jgi:hypothetical protein
MATITNNFVRTSGATSEVRINPTATREEVIIRFHRENEQGEKVKTLRMSHEEWEAARSFIEKNLQKHARA